MFALDFDFDGDPPAGQPETTNAADAEPFEVDGVAGLQAGDVVEKDGEGERSRPGEGQGGEGQEQGDGEAG